MDFFHALDHCRNTIKMFDFNALTNQNNPNEEIQIRHLDAIVSLKIEYSLFDFLSLYNNHLVIAPKTPECL